MIFLYSISSIIIKHEGCKLKCCMYIVCMMIKDKKEKIEFNEEQSSTFHIRIAISEIAYMYIVFSLSSFQQ